MSQRYLIVTTRADLSAPFFDILDARVLYYTQDIAAIEKELGDDNFSVVYFRDPFNDLRYDAGHIRKVVDYVSQKYSQAISIDQITTYDELLFEDKWRQYEIFEDFMPLTERLRNTGEFIEGRHIAKKRISSRARGVALQRHQIEPDGSYIIQDRIPITKELRVYVVNGAIVNIASVRSSKSEHRKVKTVSIEPITNKTRSVAEKILERLPRYSFVGLDIAETDDGIFLLEVNRSPQFSRYNQLTKANIILNYSLI